MKFLADDGYWYSAVVIAKGVGESVVEVGKVLRKMHKAGKVTVRKKTHMVSKKWLGGVRPVTRNEYRIVA